MNANTITAISALSKGETIQKTWGENDWSNATADEIRRFENECESKFNTDAEVKACVDEKIKSTLGGKLSGVNWGNLGASAKQLIGGITGSQNTSQYDTNVNYKSPKDNNGALILGGIAVVLAGVAIWYFGFRKK